jgi:hypothetical protein
MNVFIYNTVISTPMSVICGTGTSSRTTSTAYTLELPSFVAEPELTGLRRIVGVHLIGSVVHEALLVGVHLVGAIVQGGLVHACSSASAAASAGVSTSPSTRVATCAAPVTALATATASTATRAAATTSATMASTLRTGLQQYHRRPRHRA